MREPYFWTNCAEAMEMSFEGNRLIAQEIADEFRGFWQRSVRLLDAAFRGGRLHRNPPPV